MGTLCFGPIYIVNLEIWPFHVVYSHFVNLECMYLVVSPNFEKLGDYGFAEFV